MKMVYIAGPYSAPSYLQREENILKAKVIAGCLATAHVGFFCPHLNSAHFDEVVGENLGHEFWLGLDFRLLAACDAIFLMEGWENSVGSKLEEAEAMRLGIPVFYDDLETVIEWSRVQ